MEKFGNLAKKRVELDTEQRVIVESKSKYISVDAAPGSGKTRVIADRCHYLINSQHVSPSNIMVVSYSNRTKAILEERVPEGITVFTCHALALRFLKNTKYGKRKVMTDKERLSCLEEALNRVFKTNGNAAELWEKLPSETRHKDLLLLAELWRTNKDSAKDFYKNSSLKSFKRANALLVFAAYRKVKFERKRIDYADFFVFACNAFKDGYEVPFQHLLVDEYQDVSPAQLGFISLLSKRVESLMVVGDQHQSIYGFAGQSFQPLSGEIKGVKHYHLSRSYRLTRSCANLASAVLQSAGGSKEASVFAIQSARKGDKPILFKCADSSEQSAELCHQLQQLMANRVSPKSISILARTRAIAWDVEYQLKSQGIPALSIGTNAVGSEEQSHHMGEAFKMLALIESWKAKGIDNTHSTKEKLRDVLSRFDEELPETNIPKLSRKFCDAVKPPSLKGRYQAAFALYLSALRAKGESVKSLKRMFVKNEAFFENTTTLAQAKSKFKNYLSSEKISLSTIHAAKGGEWDFVFILNVVEGSLPFYMAKGEEAKAQELNTFYVGLTRSRVNTFIFQAPYYDLRQRKEYSRPSSFLSDDSVRKFLTIKRAKMFRTSKGTNNYPRPHVLTNLPSVTSNCEGFSLPGV